MSQPASFCDGSRTNAEKSATISPFRQRRLDDMRLRKLSQRPGPGYRRAVQSFASFLGRSPDTAALEDLRRFQLYLVDRGISPVSFNNAMNTGGAEPR